MCKKHQKACTASIYIEQSFTLVTAVTRCVSISVFALFVGIPLGIIISAI